MGICNGFQVIAEAGLVPGALLRNASLRFEHVDFSYDGKRQILRDVDFEVPAGHTVAVVGTVFVRPDAYHVDSLASHLRDTTSPASRRLYEEALAEMKNSGYVLFSEARRVAH